MPPLMPSQRWNAADEESANPSLTIRDQPRSENIRNDKIRKRSSQRSIDPAAAIPIEYRSLLVPMILLSADGH